MAAFLFTKSWGEVSEGDETLAVMASRDLTGASVPVEMGGWGTQSLSTKALTPFLSLATMPR